MNKLTCLTISTLVLLLPSAAMAHAGMADAAGFWHGLAHCFTGMDHLLAMVAVGLWATQIGGRALWAVPSSFVILMGVGGIIGFSGMQLPFIEQGILASVLIFGIFIAGAFKFSVPSSALIAGVFALCHGYAHAIEMPVTMSTSTFSVGFLLSTALLHSAGITCGCLLKKIDYANLSRLAGGAIALGGLYLAV